jgi:predicted transcriptional regulator
MAVTTSIKLSDELKARVAAMAAQEGKSAHAYLIETIEESTRAKEERARFVAEALAAKKRFDEDGLAFDAREAFAHLRALVGGKKTARPKLRQWRK